MTELTSLIQFVYRHHPCGMFKPPSMRTSFGRLISVTDPVGKFEWLAFLFPTMAYEPAKLKTPLVQWRPAPNLPLPVLMPLFLSPVGTSVKTESATPDPPVPVAPRPNLVARWRSPRPLSAKRP